MPQTNQRKSAVSGELFSASKVEAVATAIVVNGSYRDAAAAVGVDESTLRVWRQNSAIRNRVVLLRQQMIDERLAQFRSREQEVTAELYKIIFAPDVAPTPRLSAIEMYFRTLADLQASASSADFAAESDEL